MFKSVFFFFVPLGILSFSIGNMPVAADEIMIPREDVNVSSPTQVQAIVLDSNGNMTEEEYTYDPDTQVIVINSGGDNASVFFPLFATGFIWWNGYWVNREGYYYDNDRWVHVDDHDWDGHWNGYWNNHWDNHWHNHWNNHHGDPNFHYRNQEHWKNNSFQGRQRGGGHGGGAREHGGGGRGGGGGIGKN